MISPSGVTDSMTALPLNRRRRLPFWLGIALLALVLIALPALYFGSSSRLEAELARLRAEGVLLTPEELAPTVPPGHQNAADLYQQAFQAMRIPKADRNRLANARTVSNESIWSAPVSEWDPAILSLARRTVANNQVAVDLLTRAGKVPDCAFPLDLTDPSYTGVIAQFDNVSRAWTLLALRMRLLAAEGKTEAALEEYATGLRFAAHLRRQPDLTYEADANSVYLFTTRALKGMLPSTDPSPASCRRLADQLAGVDLVPASVRAQQAHLLRMVAFFDALRSGRMPASAVLGGSKSVWRVKLRDAYSTVGRPLLDQDEVASLQAMEQMIRATGEPWPQCGKDLARASQQAAALPGYRSLITRRFFSGLYDTESPPLRLRLAAGLGSTQIALALKAYQAEHGDYPADLSALEQDGWKLPLDPFTGKPYRYRRDNQGFLVYSLGEDMKDQGGQKGSASSGTTYDLPFRCER
jgi:hypothetical protein